MLSKHEIANAQLILDSNLQPVPLSSSSFREGTYDLTIGRIFPCMGEPCEEFDLQPGGVVHVMSAETVRLPQDIVGLAHVKTGLCNEGLLALNIGVVDADWSNPLGSAILNFSNETRRLKKGEEFLRLSFHRPGPHAGATGVMTALEAPQNSPGSTFSGTRCISDLPPESGKALQRSEQRGYMNGMEARARAKFTGSFLNIEALIQNVAKKQRAYVRNTILLWGAVAAVLLSIVTVIVTIGISWMVRTIEQPPAELKGTLEQLHQENRVLMDRVKFIEERSQSLRPDGGILSSGAESTRATPQSVPKDHHKSPQNAPERSDQMAPRRAPAGPRQG